MFLRRKTFQGAFEIGVGVAVLAGILLRYGLDSPWDTSVRAAILAGAASFGFWLVRPLLGWLAGPSLKRLAQGRKLLRERLARRATALVSPQTISARRDRLQRLSPRAFEELCAGIARAWGYRARTIGESGDGGIDIQMWRDGEYVVAQCKRYRGTVPISKVRDFYGAMMHVQAARGYFFTTGRFSEGAYRFVRGKPIALIDGEYLENILENL